MCQTAMVVESFISASFLVRLKNQKGEY